MDPSTFRSNAPFVGILLAAGASTRFKANKLLHPLPDGTPIAVAAARHLHAALDRVLAVVRPDVPELVRALAGAGAEVTICPDAAAGMGRSLAHAIALTSHAGGWIVALADMPFVAPDTIRRIAAALRDGADLAAPAFRGSRGHPVGFAAPYREELAALTGDAGARDILKRDRARMRTLEVDDAGVLRDIDTPEDLGGDG
ncbi:MAG: nucleotidyltransferase family protein [Burkholderiales bacterium]